MASMTRLFFLVLGLLTPVTIALYRWLLICREASAESFGKDRLSKLLLLVNTAVPALLAAGLGWVVEEFRPYTVCIGREEIFWVDLGNIGSGFDVGSFWTRGLYWNLPIYHPYR